MTFSIEAPNYRAAGYSVIPANGKRPFMNDWTKYLGSPPTENEMDAWVSQYTEANSFLLLGGEQPDNTQIINVDVDDDLLIRVAHAIIGKPLISKVGKRGEGIFVCVPNDSGIKSTTIKGAGDLGNIDILGKGKGTIIPPSIHPDTQKQYMWVDQSLLEVDPSDLPVLDRHKFKLLKAVTESEFTAQILTGQSTNEATLRLIAKLVSLGAGDEEIKAIIEALLPDDYQGNTMTELNAMIAGARKKGFDEEKKDEGKQSDIALSVLGDNIHLFRTELGEAFAEISHPNGARISDKIGSSTITEYIEYKYYRSQGQAISSQGLNEVKSTLIAKAKFTGPTEKVFVRKAYHNGCIYIDLGRVDGKTVKISADGWDITSKPPVRFRRPLGFGELPLPKRGGSFNAMYKLYGLDGPNLVLRLAFELTALSPDGPYFILLTQGSQGSGKTKQNESIKNTLDPSAAPKLRLPKTERNLAVQARDTFVLSYDNASNLSWEMSDVMCTVSTGGGLITRELYTDDGAKIFTFKRPVMLNGIGEYADRPDLLERSLQLDLARMPKGQRRSERSLDREFQKLLPQHLGALYDCVAYGLAHLDETPEIVSIRMSDAAQWLVAIEPATGFPEETFLTVIQGAQTKMMFDRIENNIICIELLSVLRKNDDRFEGTVGELHNALIGEYGRVPAGMPKTPSNLSKALTRLEPMLEVIGISFEFQEKGREGRPILILLDQDGAQFFPEVPDNARPF